MQTTEISKQWDSAAPGWAQWETVIAECAGSATDIMLDTAGIGTGDRVLDLASGAGSQTLLAARRVGSEGQVVATDISETMLEYVMENTRAAGLTNVSTIVGAAEDLDLAPDSFDAAICRFGLMLFSEPAKALLAVRHVLRPKGKLAVVVFTVPAANPFMAKPMQILLRHAGKEPPAPGQPGIFSLGSLGVIERLFLDSGFVNFEQQKVGVTLRLRSAAEALNMMQDAFGAYRAVVSDCPEDVRAAAWSEVGDEIKNFETADGFTAPMEVLVAAGTKP